MSKTLIRYQTIRKADSVNDQHSPSEIANALTASTTQEDVQEFILSQLKQIIWGSNSGNWFSNFQSSGVHSLSEVTSTAASILDVVLNGEPTTPNSTYGFSIIGGAIQQEKWTRTSDNSNIKIIDYSYSGGKLSSEVHKVYDNNGITILAQKTVSYVYPPGGGPPTYTITRDI